MTPKCALLLLLAVVPFAVCMPLDEDADGRADYAAEADSYAVARDAVAGEDYFPSLSEPAEGEFEYERPPGLLPAIVYFQEAPALDQAPNGPAPLGPSKLANKVGEVPLPPRRAPQPPPQPPARLVPALVLLLPHRGVAPGLEAPRFRQLPPLPADADERQDFPQPWPYLQAPFSRAPALPFHTVDEAEVPEPATEVRPPPVPASDITIAVIPAAEPNTSDDSDESDESDESKESKEETKEASTISSSEPEAPLTTLAPPRARRSPVGGNANANSGASSGAKSSASSSSGASGSFSSASSQASSYSEPIYFGGPTNSGSYASSSSQSSSGGGTGFGGAPQYTGSQGFGAPASGYDNFGAGSAYNPQGSQGFGSSGHGGTGYGGAGGEGNLLNRFGSLDEPGPASVQHSGTSTGKGVHSSASSSIDSTGKVTYHVQAGKF